MKRIKRRYLALKIECEVIPEAREFIDALWGTVTKLYGEVGASKTGLTLISLNGDQNFAVIRASLEALNSVKASLASITKIGGREATVHVLAVSGTLKGLKAALK